MDAGAGTILDHVFSANGMFDPDITGVGHQPIGFDQWMGTFFNHYIVVGSKIHVRAYSKTTDVATGTTMCGIQLNDESASLAGDFATVLMERPQTRYTILTNSQGSKSTVVIKKGFSAKKFFHRTDIIGDSVLRGTTTSNPSEQAYFHCWCGTPDNSSNPAGIQMIVTITYVCRLLEPNEVAPS